jgi:hypothetical protein
VHRRRSYNVFFVLFLVTVAIFAVLSRERDMIDRGLEGQTLRVIQTLLAPAPVDLESDTLWHYVDADTTRAVTPSTAPFSTVVQVRDIGPEDEATLTVKTVAYRGLLASPASFRVGPRRGVGSVDEHTVEFPVACDFDSVGRYDVLFTVHTKRVHEVSEGMWRYHNVVFRDALIPRKFIESVESSEHLLRIEVEDTSVVTPAMVQPLKIEFGQQRIDGAIGVQAENPVHVSQLFFEPELRVLRGPGKLEKLPMRSGYDFVWRGVPTRADDQVVIGARLRRGAGGKDIAQAAFQLSARHPVLASPVPSVVYDGEILRCDLHVSGLDDESQYRWRLSEIASDGSLFVKDSGIGAYVLYRIPPGYAGKSFRVENFWQGRPYRCIDPASFREMLSVFTIPIEEPPVHLVLDLPPRVPARHVFRFSAYQYNDLQYRTARPVRSTKDIDFILKAADGMKFAVAAGMTTYGYFEYSLVNPQAVPSPGTAVELTLRVKGRTIETRKLYLTQP